MTRIDDTQFTELYQQHWSPQLNTLCRDWHMYKRPDLQDVLQVAWLEAWRTWDCDMDNRGSFVQWVWRHIRQQLYRRIQTKRARINNELIPILDKEESSEEYGLYDPGSVDGQQVVDLRDMICRIYAVVRCRDNSRHTNAMPWEPVITCLITGYNYREIAAKCSMASDKSVAMLIVKIRRFFNSHPSHSTTRPSFMT